MKGEAKPLIKFLEGADKRIIIPLYQRNYDWKEDNCEQLFQDLMKLHNSNRKNHFFGGIVSSITEDRDDSRYIIDGQQRITTVSLLLIAMFNAQKEGLLKSVDSKLPEKIFECYLVDKYQQGERKVKLKPIKKDMEAFDALFKSKDKYIMESNVTRNYGFFYNEIIKSGLTIDDLFDSIKKLEIIDISLGEDDDPQLIFESLNSTGLYLSEADKIRNYLLMSLSPSDQDDLYTRYWNPIEESTKFDPTSFVRDYLTMKRGQICRFDQIYFIFKKFAEGKSVDKLLKEMRHYAEIYSQIDNAKIGSERLNRKVNQFRTLDLAVIYPFYMAFFDYASNNGLNEDEIYKVMDVIEAYLARRIICSQPSNALSKVFTTLHRDVSNYLERSKGDDSPSYISILTYVLLRKEGTSIFPRDEEVRERFCTREVYKMLPNARMFLMERMENRDSNERHDVVKELSEECISIEHIMPQTLSEEWKNALGNEWEKIHQYYLHTMANLTLTGYNSRYSNQTFAKKRDMEKGFKDSAFRLNNYVKSCDKWTEEELKQRQQELLEVFMGLWPMPETSFKPAIRNVETASLDDEDFEFTGKNLQAYRFRGERHTVKTWKEMLRQVCEYFISEKYSTMSWVCANGKYGFSSTPEVSKKDELSPRMYLWSNTSTSAKIKNLRGLFGECNIPSSDLLFEFKSDEV